MTALLKPTPRGPKPRTRLKRSPLPRRGAPLKRGKRPRARKAGATAALRREATDLASRICRHLAGGRCEFRDPGMRRCVMAATDAAHTLNKKVHPAARFELLGLLAMCRLHHDMAGDAKVVKPSALREMFIALRGREAWEVLLRLAARAKTFSPETVADLRATASALGIILPPLPAASTARKGKPVTHTAKGPIAKRPKSHQVVKESQAVAGGSVETARRRIKRHSWEWFDPHIQMCIKEGCLLEREMKTPTATAYPTGRYRWPSVLTGKSGWFAADEMPACVSSEAPGDGERV
jgi:hypothetical protein